MHQTIIGQEALKQMEIAGDYPDIVIAPFGGGSNFAGIAFPFLENKLTGGKNIRAIAVEPTSCPKLTRGVFRYDFGDTVGMTPLIPMYTLGHNFIPSPIHAGGLRYHGAGAIVSQLLKDKIIEADAINQTECFDAGILFAQTEGIISAPEATHAIAEAVRQARQADEEGVGKTILFNLCGHGHFDLSAYEQYLEGKLVNFEVTQEEINESLAELNTPVI
jgi:tryptophan synthase beta chain